MKRTLQYAFIVVISAAFTYAASAQQAQPAQQPQRATVVEGKIVRTDKDMIVIKDINNKEVTVYTTPQTTYQITEKGGTFTDLRPDTTVGVYYDTRDNRMMATRVVGLQMAEGEVVRVVGKDQVIIRTPDKKEITVYVSPQTIYQLNQQGAGTFTDLTPGANINVYYNNQDRQFRAFRFFRRNK
jgi:hypothetical protein